MNATESIYRGILIKCLDLPDSATDQQITEAAAAFEKKHRCRTLIESEIKEMQEAAKVAGKNGMFESGARLRAKADGMARALEILKQQEGGAE